jgi:hypothetical protein
MCDRFLATDEGASAPRITIDVDAIAEIISYAEYAKFGDRLRVLGFTEGASEGAPLCRWVHQQTAENPGVFKPLVQGSDEIVNNDKILC